MKVLLLGGTGAMGNYLAAALADKGHDVYATTRSKIEAINAGRGRVVYIRGNAHEIPFLRETLKERWDVVVDFMVYNSAEFKIRIDALLTSSEQYVFLSSARVYAASDTPIVEESPRLLDVCRDKKYLATDEYALTKARQEDMLRSSAYKNWTIVRPYITYSDERMQLGVFEKENWLYRALSGHTVVFPEDIASHTTTMTYGADVAEGILKLIGNDKALSETVHIASPESMKWSEILDIYVYLIEKYTGKRPRVCMARDSSIVSKICHNNYQICYDRLFDRTFDSSKLDRICGEKMTYTPLKDGLELCFSSFIGKNKKFIHPGGVLDGYFDRISGEIFEFDADVSLGQRARYYATRYLPLTSALFMLKVANKVRRR